MKIIIKPEIMYRLMAYAAITKLEYSGFGFCERKDGDIVIYDFVLLDVGDPAYTEIDPKLVLPLLQREDRKNMKVWLHRHPMGDGIPGRHNWSGRDEQTIQREPLGATPEAVNWSVSVVLTPGGFVGRVDNYVKHLTQHLEVEPNTRNLVQEVRDLASQSPFVNYMRKHGESFPSSLLGGQDFPAQETQEHRRRVKISGKRKKGKKRTTKTPTTSMPPISSEPTEMDTQTFLKRYGSSARNTIQLVTPLRTSATTTGSIGTPSDPTTSEGSDASSD